MVALASALLAATAALPGAEPPTATVASQNDCPTVVRIFIEDPEQIAGLASWIEPWEISRDRSWLIAGVDAAGLDRLGHEGLRFEVDHALTERVCAPQTVPKAQDGGIPGFPCYRTLAETFAAAATLADEHPDLAAWIDIGDSWERLHPGPDGSGHDLMVLRLTNSATTGTGTPTAPDRKPVLAAFGGIHAREYAPPELLTRFAEHLVNGYGADPDATWLLDEHEIHLVLYANPDGRSRAETGQLWRKNADNDYCTNTPNRGADLNRNFEFRWACCNGSSDEPCSELYRGAAPASEPETATLQQYLRAVFPDHWTPEPGDDTTGVFLDVHSYGELVLWPWGSTQSITPNHAGLRTLARKLAYLNGHLPQRGVDFYPVDGGTLDFAYGALGVATFTVEIGTSFFQPCVSFESAVLDRNLDALLYAARVARSPYVTPSGPEVYLIQIDPAEAVRPGEQVHVTAWLSDTFFSRAGAFTAEPTQPIAAVEVYVARPPWSADAPQPVLLDAVDGELDDVSEGAEGWVDTSGLAPGRHLLFFRGQDEDGVWGPVKAEFLHIRGAVQTPRRPSGRLRP